MELSDKIQKLRKDKKYTQEQFAEMLCVSRTAVSKWETGRGIPSIESLQQIAKLFNITLDELLSTEEIAVIAETENEENINRFIKYICSVINVSALLGLLLPLYKTMENGYYYSVPVYQLNGWQGTVFCIAPIVMTVLGIFEFLSVKSENAKVSTALNSVGTSVHILAILIFVLCGHPYPTLLYFFLFAVKCAFLLKKHK